MLMPHSSPGERRAWLPHVLAILGIVASTLVLYLWPGRVLNAGYRCQLDALLGIRCPFCGMTRDFAAMLHGQKPMLNPCSGVAAVVVYGVYPLAVTVAWRRKRLEVFSSRAVHRSLAVILAVMLVLNNLH